MPKKMRVIALPDKHVVAARRTIEIPGFAPMREWVLVEVVPFGKAEFSPVIWRGVFCLSIRADASREEAEQFILDNFQGRVK